MILFVLAGVFQIDAQVKDSCCLRFSDAVPACKSSDNYSERGGWLTLSKLILGRVIHSKLEGYRTNAFALRSTAGPNVSRSVCS